MKTYIEFILKYRKFVIAITILVTLFLGFQIRNLHVVIDPNTNLPQDHPYVITTNKIEKWFSSKNIIVIGVTPNRGDAFQHDVLEKVKEMTTSLMSTQGIVKENVLSIAASKAKWIKGTADGMEVKPFLDEKIPESPEALETLRNRIRSNPIFYNLIISKDERTASIIIELKDPKNGYQEIMGKIRAIVDPQRDTTVDIAVGGWPVYGAEFERYSQRMGFLFPLAVLLIGLIHYEAFRTFQGLILPLVTSLLAVVWGVGIMGLSGVPMDAFNASTPILILAVAAGHAVQILKRYYEEYHRLRQTTLLTPEEASQKAISESMLRIGYVMLTAGMVAVLGFFSLIVFKMTVIKTFGIFTGLGILCALILEMTFIPSLRSLLPPPKEREEIREREERIWDRVTASFAQWITSPSRWKIYLFAGMFLVVGLVGMFRVTIENANKQYFSKNLDFQKEDARLNEQLGGTADFHILVEGGEEDAIKNPKILKAMDDTEQFLNQQPYVGKTISLADFIKRMNQAMNGDDPKFAVIPDSQELISQYLLLYSMSGDPLDFDSYVDNGYQNAEIKGFLKTDNSVYLQKLVSKLNPFMSTAFRQNGRVRVSVGGGAPSGAAMNEVIVQGKILNVLQIGGVIYLISSLVFRSFFAGFFVLVPLLLAAVGNFAIMGYGGIRLNIGTSVILAMTVGIGTDYAIYLIYRLREEIERGGDIDRAFQIALTTAGKGVLYVATAVSIGYGVLLFSFGFYIHLWFGMLTAAAMFFSSFAALTILPALVYTLKPDFIFNQKRARAIRSKEITVAILLAAGFYFLLIPQATAAELSGEEIMEKNFKIAKVQDSVSNATFTLVNKGGQERIRKTFGTTKLQSNGIDNMRMTRFNSPSDVKGTSTLIIEHADQEDEIWVYLPALRKVRRLVSSNKKESFMGTDFSYGDVIGYKVSDWHHQILKEEEIDHQACYLIESLPKNDLVRSTNGY
ncbi:MAG: MMPL family transporter, partial [Nitrospirae bacterium]|nr:MMPL family transporter [Nitrospirota bacterium]